MVSILILVFFDVLISMVIWYEQNNDFLFISVILKKYPALLFKLFQESKEKRKEKQLQLTNGSLPIHVESSPVQHSPGTDNRVNKAKLGQSAAAKIVAKLSPKSTRRKVDKTAKMKVNFIDVHISCFTSLQNCYDNYMKSQNGP